MAHWPRKKRLDLGDNPRRIITLGLVSPTDAVESVAVKSKSLVAAAGVSTVRIVTEMDTAAVVIATLVLVCTYNR